jgi:hypothetical protein
MTIFILFSPISVFSVLSALRHLYTPKTFSGPLAMLPCYQQHACQRAVILACGLNSFSSFALRLPSRHQDLQNFFDLFDFAVVLLLPIGLRRSPLWSLGVAYWVNYLRPDDDTVFLMKQVKQIGFGKGSN